MEWQNLHVYASLGWPLFPCSNRSKVPLTPHGFKDATTDLQQLKAWHEQFPACAWGCATSAERGVLDIDPRSGGSDSLLSLTREHGPMPLTPTVRTGGNGLHYWLRFPAGTGCGIVAPGIDRKASGGYVIVPPSKIDCPQHEGRAYAWEVRPWDTPIAEAPAWLNARAKPKGTAGASADAANPWVVRASGDDLLTHPGAKQSNGEQRRPTLCRLVGVHLARGDSETTITAMASAWAGRCEPPLEPHDWEPHVERLCRKEEAKQEARGLTRPHASPPTPIASGIIEYRDDSVVPPEASKEVTNSGADADGELFTSFLPPEAEPAQGEEAVCVSSAWPTLRPDARHGLLGEMLNAVEAETEADPAGVLLGFLACFGNIVGRGAWVPVDATNHYPGLFVGVVGEPSASKGPGWSRSLWPFAQAEPQWAKSAVCYGVGSGQGLIDRVRDERRVQKWNKKTGQIEEEVIPAAPEKRCMIRLEELAACFKLQRGDTSTLGENLLTAFDYRTLETLNTSQGENYRIATEYAICVFGDIQPGRLRKLLESGKSVEQDNGFMSRFLWARVKPRASLPGGGNGRVLEPYIARLREALSFGKNAGEYAHPYYVPVTRGAWNAVYDSLRYSGDTVPHTEKARPQVLRLSLIYALADKSKVITEPHLRAALAVWDYCRQSAALIFSGSVQPEAGAEPEPLWLRLLNAITSSPGISRSDLTKAAKNVAKAEAVGEALAYLERHGMAYSRAVQASAGGRPAECWYPGPKPGGEGEGDGRTVDTHLPPLSLSDEAGADPWVVREGSKEVTNSAPATALEPGELVTSLLPSGEPEPEGVSEAGGSEARVNRKAGGEPQAHFTHGATGGFGVGDEAEVWEPELNAFAQRLDTAD